MFAFRVAAEESAISETPALPNMMQARNQGAYVKNGERQFKSLDRNEAVVSMPRPIFNEPPPKQSWKIYLCITSLVAILSALLVFALYIASAPKNYWNGNLKV
jgi:hypothetical protein